MTINTWIGQMLRRLADRIDHAGAPKAIGWSAQIIPGRGMTFRHDLEGCPLWYLGNEDARRMWPVNHPSTSAPAPRLKAEPRSIFPAGSYVWLGPDAEPPMFTTDPQETPCQDS